jgi:hypothetical protein
LRFIHNWVMIGIQWMVCWWVLVHLWQLINRTEILVLQQIFYIILDLKEEVENALVYFIIFLINKLVNLIFINLICCVAYYLQHACTCCINSNHLGQWRWLEMKNK